MIPFENDLSSRSLLVANTFIIASKNVNDVITHVHRVYKYKCAYIFELNSFRQRV